jgi:hypothetical protein
MHTAGSFTCGLEQIRGYRATSEKLTALPSVGATFGNRSDVCMRRYPKAETIRKQRKVQ